MHNPMLEHMDALKRIVMYVKALELGLHICKSSTSTLISYTDANWGSVWTLDAPHPGIAFFLVIIFYLSLLSGKPLCPILVPSMNIEA